MYFKNQKFLVAGMSRSGESAARFLIDRGADVYLYDDVESQRIDEVASELEKLGAHRVKREELEAAAENCDILVLSPGIPIDNPLPLAFGRRGKSVIGEEELGAMFLRATSVLSLIHI